MQLRLQTSNLVMGPRGYMRAIYRSDDRRSVDTLEVN